MVDVNPVTELIAECQRDFLRQHGIELSYADIARRGQPELTRGRVQQMATEPVKAMPSYAKIEALARGLGVPYSVVLERYLQASGYLPEQAAPSLRLAARRGVPEHRSE